MNPANDDALDELAGVHLQGGRVGAAIDTMHRRLEAQPDAQGHLVYAGLLERLGLLSDAEQHYRAALAEPSTALEAASGLGCSWRAAAASTRPSPCCAPPPTVSAARRATRITRTCC